MKKKYICPASTVITIPHIVMLTGSPTSSSVPYDPDERTGDALSNMLEMDETEDME